ncbi:MULTISPECIES: SIR2 family protein [Sphingobacterium]|uniref:SIR2 family protein n=1 Tax=Sphingobacterium TaxID=28453 RepID=UPI00257A8CA3|nr:MULTISPECIES: SIR2 family protein [Sphingobacterium]
MINYYLEYDQFIRSIDVSFNHSFSIFLGAGASINSGIPSAYDCIWEWKKKIYSTSGPKDISVDLDLKSEHVRTFIQNWLDNQGGYPRLDDPSEYSFYVENCFFIKDDIRLFFQSICEKKTPSIGYKLCCQLHEAGIIDTIWTTNFDDLVQGATSITNNTLINVSLDTVERIFRADNRKELLLIKLHGDYKYGNLKNTEEELKTQDATFRKHLIEYIKNKHLIISGYSGRDDSIMDALMESYSQKGGGRLYWCGYGRNIPEKVKKLIEVARENNRIAYYIPTDGFDKLMLSLCKISNKIYPDLASKYAVFLQQEPKEHRTPFTIDVRWTNSIVKSNLFPIELPQDIYQFEIKYDVGIGAWELLKCVTKDYDIVAVPFKKYVWAMGKTADINSCFGSRMLGKITRVHLEHSDVRRSSVLSSLMLSALTQLFAKKFNLQTNNKDLLWFYKHDTARMLNNTLYLTHKAIRLSIVSDNTRMYMSLMPDFKVTSSDPEVIVSNDVRQEVGRQYFEKMRNKEFNDYLNDWRRRLLNSEEKTLNLEFPLDSGTGFIFKIDKSPAFAKIMDSSAQYGTIDLSKCNVPYNLFKFKGIQYPEPLLLFSNKHDSTSKQPRDFHPMRGVAKNKPYDDPTKDVFLKNKIQLAVICPREETDLFSTFLKLQNTKISSNKKNIDYLIDYPGFYDAFNSSLEIPDVADDNWSICLEPKIGADIKFTILDLRDKIIDRINFLSRDRSDKVMVICIPTRWLYYLDYDIDNESFDLHDFIKAYCAEKGIATQFILQSTVEDKELSCQINWWLALSYFVKSMRTPWVLQNLDPETAFAGIGYSLAGKGKNSEIMVGCSHIYNSKGQGLKYKLSKVEDEIFWDHQKSPHLSYDDAYSFGVSIRDLFYKTMEKLPKRVVIHKRTFYTNDELNGLKDSLLGNGIEELDLIEINFEENMRFLASIVDNEGRANIDGYAVKRGTCILLSKYSALLWTHGVVTSVQSNYRKYYLGGRFIPGPLKIIKHHGNSNIGTIANEILGLTKVNWNSFDLYSQLPATVSSSNDIARIGKLLSKREGITYDYRYFI